MAVSSRPDHFFQTDSSLEEIERRSRKAKNNHGNPIKLQSKILAVTANPYKYDGTVYVAESAATIKEIALTDGVIKKTIRGPTAPLTCLTFGPDGEVFAGCWDKTIWCFPNAYISASSGAAASPVQFLGHIDFLKCLLYTQLPDKSPLLISGSADGDILFWNPSNPSARYLYRLAPQSRSIEHLVLDPLSPADAPVVFFSTSQREIYHFTLPNSLTGLKSIRISEPIIAHETSVYKLTFDADGDLWTASADKTAKHLVRHDGWVPDTTLLHPDFVRDIAVHERGGWVITACRDEEVRVWDSSTGKLHHVFSGHFEEVTGLCLVGDTVVSVGIDATVRRWDVSPVALRRAVEEAKNPSQTEEEGEKKVEENDLGLTEEEEAELRAMMEDEEETALEKMARDDQ